MGENGFPPETSANSTTSKQSPECNAQDVYDPTVVTDKSPQTSSESGEKQHETPTQENAKECRAQPSDDPNIMPWTQSQEAKTQKVESRTATSEGNTVQQPRGEQRTRTEVASPKQDKPGYTELPGGGWIQIDQTQSPVNSRLTIESEFESGKEVISISHTNDYKVFALSDNSTNVKITPIETTEQAFEQPDKPLDIHIERGDVRIYLPESPAKSDTHQVAKNASGDSRGKVEKQAESPDSKLDGSTKPKESTSRRWPIDLANQSDVSKIINPKIQGADTPAMGRIMKGLHNTPIGEKPDKLLGELAQVRGIPLDKIQMDYVRYMELRTEAQNSIIRGFAKLDNNSIKPLYQEAFWGSTDQLRFGQIVGDAFGIDPVFGSLLNPTGGLVGQGDMDRAIREFNPAVGESELRLLFPAIKLHGAVHDAGGYLLNCHDVGPGYHYVSDASQIIDKHNPLAGHADGIAFWYKLLSFIDNNKEDMK